MKESVKIVISILSTLLPLISAILVIVMKYVKSEKGKKIAETINYYVSELNKYVKEAEKIIDGGKAKKEFVMNKIEKDCKESGKDFNKQEVSLLLEKLISTTKEVNAPVKK